MMIICPKNFTPDDVSKIDFSKNIVICVMENQPYITRKEDLTFSVSHTYDVNVSTHIVEVNNQCSFIHDTYLKISHPIGLKLKIEPTNQYISKVYHFGHEYYGYENEQSKIARYKLTTIHQFKILFDKFEMKRMRSSFLFKKEEPIVDFWFQYIYTEPELSNELGEIYLIRHNQLFEDFEKLVL